VFLINTLINTPFIPFLLLSHKHIKSHLKNEDPSITSRRAYRAKPSGSFLLESVFFVQTIKTSTEPI
jgi:hypothetical protein